MDWSLYRCGRSGHVTYAPDEPRIRAHMHASTAGGELWQCVRCGTFVPGAPQGSGPVARAPMVRRGKEIRSELILRMFAIERFLRALLFGAIAYGVWRFGHSRLTIEQAFARELPVIRALFRQLGYNVDKSSLVGLFRHALQLKPTTLTLIAVGLAGYAAVEVVEGVGLWQAKRWGEYFAAAVTSLGLPYEIYEIYDKFTWTRLALFGVNLALVLYLVLTKRLFGARGGKDAYEARLRSESVFDTAARIADEADRAAPDAVRGQAASANPHSAGPHSAGPHDAEAHRAGADAP